MSVGVAILINCFFLNFKIAANYFSYQFYLIADLYV